jgi:hypothetical protein
MMTEPETDLLESLDFAPTCVSQTHDDVATHVVHWRCECGALGGWPVCQPHVTTGLEFVAKRNFWGHSCSTGFVNLTLDGVRPI